jgi:hypothetical protein
MTAWQQFNILRSQIQMTLKQLTGIAKLSLSNIPMFSSLLITLSGMQYRKLAISSRSSEVARTKLCTRRTLDTWCVNF